MGHSQVGLLSPLPKGSRIAIRTRHTNRDTVKPLVLLAGATLAVLVGNRAEAADGLVQIDAQTLQSDFAEAKDLVVEPDWHDLPPDAARLLEHVGKNIVAGKPGVANIGEEWSTTDFVLPNLPIFQHLFSAYSDEVTASVFIVG